MKKIYKISREEATRQAALAGITPLPEDSPYFNEGASIQFLSRSHLPTSSTKPAAKTEEKKPSQE
jgi:hypothetical protein